MRWLRHGIGWTWLALGYTFVFLPVVVLVLFSFTSRDVPLPPFEGPSLEWYQRIFDNDRMVDALVNSVVLAAVSSFVATVLGFLGAYGIARHRSRWEGVMRYVIMAPITVSYLIVGIGLLVTFHVMGVPKSLWAVGVGHVVINLPLCFSIILAGLGEHQRNLERAAQDLGASELAALLRVTVPVSLPSILAAYCLSFTLSWDEFIIAFLLTRFDVTLPVMLFELLRGGSSPELNAAGSVVFGISMSVVLIAAAVAMIGRRRA
ncbi:MAG: ABC transporter permease [Thiotrichales bacterium]|nr:ABC transporter permease [Thiotrichales bacterium]MCY4286297.1 ABC transporter permease [Thiotrichales bacterium]MCY4351431.1 ABC transporter permease [Thiotrichales bacterium]